MIEAAGGSAPMTPGRTAGPPQARINCQPAGRPRPGDCAPASGAAHNRVPGCGRLCPPAFYTAFTFP